MNCIKNILYQLSSSLDHTNEEFIDQQKLYYRTDKSYIYDDYVFESEINYTIQLTQQSYEKMLYKDVLTDGFFGLMTTRNTYYELCFESQKKIHFDLIKRYIEVQVILLAPICPHICEYVYQLLHPTTSIMNANWPPLEQVTIGNYDLPDGDYNITYSSISNSALSTCHFYLITGILNDKNFGYLLHSSKDFQSSSHTPKTTVISTIKYIVHDINKLHLYRPIEHPNKIEITNMKELKMLIGGGAELHDDLIQRGFFIIKQL
ncbi:unnamed protein product [Rotaria sordida]|uniref:Methionyl/Valyl/Leucyl/Isoleucyl-tRNA synthetase anticodon-binding domain-containing protein n=1 Tax=Rotaria sordida TaxID=392033 RepID=A0A819VVG8_9BILA|nr:unnamed protein product [Rotaria sordida]CAF4113539.1 unnamed protein product [Rotaria sordida]